MLLYYITDRKQFPGGEAERRVALLERIGEAAQADVDYIQLREKDLDAGELAELAFEAQSVVRKNSDKTLLLINSRSDVALAVGSDGVHLTSTDISAADARALVASAMRGTKNEERGTRFVIGVSCHSVAEVRMAESQGADFVVLAPIFEKAGTTNLTLGLDSLQEATLCGQSLGLRVEAGDTRRHVPVIALGGITLSNAPQCLAAGAAGIAGRRLFQSGDLASTVRELRSLRLR